MIIECANCGKTVEASENIAIQRLHVEAKDYFSEIHPQNPKKCEVKNLFVRTVYPPGSWHDEPID